MQNYLSPLTLSETSETKTWNEIIVTVLKCTKTWDKGVEFLQIGGLFQMI